MERISKLNCEVISAVQIRFLVDTVRSSWVRLFCRQGSFLKSSLNSLFMNMLCGTRCDMQYPGLTSNKSPIFSKLKSRPYKFYFLGLFLDSLI